MSFRHSNLKTEGDQRKTRPYDDLGVLKKGLAFPWAQGREYKDSLSRAALLIVWLHHPAAVSPGNLLAMQILGHHPRPPESEPLGAGPGDRFNKPCRDSGARLC